MDRQIRAASSLQAGVSAPIMILMSAPRFHLHTLATGIVRLSAPETRHASRSRRLSVGDELVLFDGAGREAAGRIVSMRGAVEVEIAHIVERPRPVPLLTLALALPKGPRQDVLVEKATELGVGAIQPLVTDRSIASASVHKQEKWRQTTIEAAKQSRQCWLPGLLPLRPLRDFASGRMPFDRTVVACTSEDLPVAAIPILTLLPELARAGSILAFIGPEGGWTPAEVEHLASIGGQPVSLGPSVLRVETAAIALAAAIHSLARPQTPPQQAQANAAGPQTVSP